VTTLNPRRRGPPLNRLFRLKSRALTQRERLTVMLVAEGLINKEIAKELGITVKTVETHRANAMKKVDAHSVAMLVRYAVRVGLVDDIPMHCCRCQLSMGY